GLARGAVLGLPAPAILDVLGGDGEARLATWRTDEGVIGGVTVSLKAESSPRRDDRFLRVIETIGKSLSGASNVSDVLDTVVSTAMQVMRADSAMVVGWDGRAPDLDILRIVGRLGASYAPGGTLPVTSGPMSRAAREARTIVTRDILADPRMHVGPERAERIARAGFKSVMAAPMIVKGTVHGALGVYYWNERTFGEDEIAVLTLLGQHAALV